jgi:hypothetical protein
MQTTINCGGKEVPHNTVPWRVATNRHTNCDGTAWGWIEGAPGHVCWTNETKKFDREKAGAVVAEHNRWLEEQKPIALRIIEATNVASKARQKAEAARKEADDCEAALDAALVEVARLEAKRDEASNVEIERTARLFAQVRSNVVLERTSPSRSPTNEILARYARKQRSKTNTEKGEVVADCN